MTIFRPWLMTPLRNPVPGPEERFNTALTSVRSLIERCNGLLKNRWRCLLKHRFLHYSPEKAANITKACCVLHNMCIARNIPDLEQHEEVDYDINLGPHRDIFDNENANPDLHAARNIQRRIINTFVN